MKHLGDITLIHGNEIEPADCIIGGSPCQDLSVAGKRAGLSGERSGLFMEQIRIVKEMRKRYGKPRYMVWENVPGAFSSNNGEDFRAVLEEITKIADETAVIPRPPKGKWSYAGCVMGDGWSVAWRTHDAQFWGVPQRRRRIALVADFGGESAPEILFERESVSGDTESGRETREGTAANLENSIGNTVWCLQGNGIDRADTAGCNGRGWRENVSYTLNTIDRPAVCYDMTHANDVIRDCGHICPNLQGRMGTGGNQVPICIGNGQVDQLRMSDKVGALNCMHDQQAIISIDRAAFNQGKNALYGINISDDGIAPSQVAKGPNAIYAAVDCRNGTENSDVNGTLQAKSTGGQSLNLNNAVRYCGTVRRLTPLECERLQGYPDGWTDIGDWTDSKGKLHKAADAPRYKALGNSIALPFWLWMLRRMSEYLSTGATIGSLFDGIGGFPLLWERIHGAGTARWASEIEEFAIAVTKIRFPEEATK